jgi:hypothetical protein
MVFVSSSSVALSITNGTGSAATLRRNFARKKAPDEQATPKRRIYSFERGHRRAGPMGRFVRRFLHGQSHDPLGDRGIELWDARGPRLVAQKPVHALGGEPFLPAPDASLGLAGLAHDRVRADALGAEQHDLRAPNVLLRRVAVFDQSAQPIKVGRRHRNGNAGSHAADSHAASPPGIPTGIQMSDAIH